MIPYCLYLYFKKDECDSADNKDNISMLILVRVMRNYYDCSNNEGNIIIMK